MATFRGDNQAFGGPGIEARWTHGGKEGVGTAYAASSRLWFTLWRGIVTELYYPTVDRPQTRDLQFLISDGEFVHEEKRHFDATTTRLDPALGYRVEGRAPDGAYTLTKEIIADPHLPCLLVNARLDCGEAALREKLRLYVLLAPHLNVGGAHNNGYVVEAVGRQILVAEKNGTWLACAATLPFARLSCGYVGASDGWTDLTHHKTLTWEFDRALDGNIALTGELDVAAAKNGDAFTLGVAFGDGLHSALTTLFQALGVPFEEQKKRFVEQWERPARHRLPLETASGDGGALFRTSYNLLLAHEDKTYQGALIASLSIPWGEARGDEDLGGYHLVWPRDMVNSAEALLACGNTETPLRALIYLAAAQQPDGRFAQNFWIRGEPYWTGVQLDEAALPILLAHRLKRLDALKGFDAYPLVRQAAGFLVRRGPVTDQERWEEAGGYSPATLGAVIAALVCAADFARDKNDAATSAFLLDYADYLECRLDDWTTTTQGTLVASVSRHYVRITPSRAGEPPPENGADEGTVFLANQPPEAQKAYPARDIVDAGFLALVRYGLRSPDDPLIINSLIVVDALLRRDTPQGACWLRYNHDGYGQRENGDPFADGWGTGHAWPLLAGERGCYELAAGRTDVSSFLHALEAWAAPNCLLPEQVWDADDLPERYLRRGGPTGAAMPLAWAHAEYLKLLRSVRDKQVFDHLPVVAGRYQTKRAPGMASVPWSHNHPVARVTPGRALRIQASEPFRLRWSRDGWQTQQDTDVTRLNPLGVGFVDIPTPPTPSEPLRFTFFWLARDAWEGREHAVAIEP